MSTGTADAGGSPHAEASNTLYLWPARLEGSQKTLPAGVHEKTCAVCKDEVLSEPVLEMPSCRHTWCAKCLSRMFQYAMKSEQSFPAHCCGESIPIDKAKHLFSKDFVHLYRDREIEFGSPIRLYCHVQTCSRFIGHCAGEGRRVTCPRCKSATCRDCKAAHHVGECPEDPSKTLLMALAVKEGYRQCYRCDRLVEHVDGCRNMTWVSRPISPLKKSPSLISNSCLCNAQFCYTCGGSEEECDCSEREEEEFLSRLFD